MKRLAQAYHRYVDFMQDRQWLRLFGWLMVLLASIPVASIEVENRLEEWFPDDAKIVKQNQQFVEDFGHDEWMFFYFVFLGKKQEYKRLETVGRVCDSLRTIKGLNQVFARSDVRNLMVFVDSGQIPYLRKVDSMYFATRDGRGEMIYLRQERADNPNEKRYGILDSIEQKTAFLPGKIKTHITGSGVIFTEIDRLSNQDGGLLMGIAFIFMVVILAFRVDSRKRLGLILILLLLCYLPAVSLFGWSGIDVNMVNMVVPLLFIILFGAYLLHLTSHSDRPFSEYYSIKVIPVCLAAITTIIGLGSLVISEFPIIRQFGITASGGLAIGLLVILVLGIPEIRAVKDKAMLYSDRSRLDSLVYQLLYRFYRQLSHRRAVILTAVALLVSISGLYFFSHIKVDTNSLSFLPKDNQVRKDVNRIEQSFGYFNPVDFVLKKNDEEWQETDWRNLRKLRTKLNQLTFVGGIVGYDQWYRIDNRFIQNNARPLFISDDSMRTRMMVRIPMGSAGEMERYYDQVMEIVNGFGEKNGYEVSPAGYLPLYLYQMNNIVSGMLYNLTLALILILLMIFLVIRDWKLGLLSLFPNIFPLLTLSLIMYLFEVPFDISSAVIACMVIGIVVDDSLHILWYYRQGRQSKDTGLIFSTHVLPYIRPITNSTLIFGLGFLVLLFSRVGSIENMGFLCSLALFVAWVCDLLIFPAVLKLVSAESK